MLGMGTRGLVVVALPPARGAWVVVVAPAPGVWVVVVAPPPGATMGGSVVVAITPFFVRGTVVSGDDG